MSAQSSAKTFTIEQVLASSSHTSRLTNLKFMVGADSSKVSSDGLERAAAKLMHAKMSGILAFSKTMRTIKSENYLLSDIVG